MRSHYCGQVTETLVDQEVEVCGWVHRRRDHGGVIFIDLRDRDGIVQVVFPLTVLPTLKLPNGFAMNLSCVAKVWCVAVLKAP